MTRVIKFNKEKIKKHFGEEQIKAYAIQKKLSELGALAYLYFYNHVSISTDMQRKDNGRAMYLEFAKGLQRLILDCCDIEYTKEEQACK